MKTIKLTTLAFFLLILAPPLLAQHHQTWGPNCTYPDCIMMTENVINKELPVVPVDYATLSVRTETEAEKESQTMSVIKNGTVSNNTRSFNPDSTGNSVPDEKMIKNAIEDQIPEN